VGISGYGKEGDLEIDSDRGREGRRRSSMENAGGRRRKGEERH
jgi:hypothetical protein